MSFKSKALITMIIILSLILPSGVFAASSKTASPSSISYYVTDNGHLGFKWSAVSGADKYTLLIRNLKMETSETISTKNTYYVCSGVSVLRHGCSFTASVTATDTSGGLVTSASRSLQQAVQYVDPAKLYISNPKLKINIGKKRKLRVTFDTGVNDVCSYNGKLTGRWVSSKPAVASVSQAGNVRAKAAGTTYVTYRAIDGLSVTSKVTVPSKAAASGSMYISNGHHASWHQVLGNLSMRKGAQNRLNGTVVSDVRLSRIYVYLYDSQGAKVKTYSKSVSAYSYDLTKISRNIKFSKLPKGRNKVRIVARNARGTAVLYSAKFKVTGKPGYSSRGGRIVATALTRQGDPYSQLLRGISNYTDCSYLTLWSYQQAAGVSLPATAANQYKYCVENDKDVSDTERTAGDLVFWGGKSNGRYKGIWHTAVYMGNNLVCHANGYKTEVDTINTNSKYPIYYGRPY